MPAGHDWKKDSPAIIRTPSVGLATGISHPSYPFEGQWNAADAGHPVPKIAMAYLDAVKQMLGLPLNLLKNTGEFRPRPSGMQLTWLPISAPDAPVGPINPRHSFWLRRYDDPANQANLIDRTAVLAATVSSHPNDPATALGSRLGIRIVAHVAASGAAPWHVRITSASCSTGLASSLDTGDAGFSILTASLLGEVRDQGFKVQLANAAGLEGYGLYIDGLRVLRPATKDALIDLYVNAPAVDEKSLAYALTVRMAGDLGAGFADMQIKSIQRRPLRAHAQVRPNLFPLDPASQAGVGALVGARSNRAPERMPPFLAPTTLKGLNEAGGSTTLTDGAEIEVMQSNVGDRAADETQPQVVVLAEAGSVRTRAHTALSAYQRAMEFFDALKGGGFTPSLYFRHAKVPLRVRHRATIQPGPGKDGRTVNAQVDFDPAHYEAGDAWNQNALRQIQVRFALADLKRSAALARRQPIGIACDPRWAWHEFGHVLLAASTGELEFRFAHSAGDALAAILCDPDSKLAAHPRMRYATFPWAYLNRRHDRDVRHGWSWCGTRHRQRRFPPDGAALRHKGYESEQILSTTLFRLYRALGGEALDKNGHIDVVARREAANYAAYLIMRAIGECGAESTVTIEDPSQFEATLRDADTATSSMGQRIGGCAHKLVRWAFEMQGLPISPDWDATLNAPAPPPDSDLFIDNGRPAADSSADRGGYMPVSLDWESATPPPWHADGFVTRSGKNIRVHVRNRGGIDVPDARVGVWYAAVQGPSAPNWNSTSGNPPVASWTPASGGPAAPKTVKAWPDPGETFGQFKLPSASASYWVLAAVTCAADPANIDPVTALPCVTAETRIADLVGGDNNIAIVKV